MRFMFLIGTLIKKPIEFFNLKNMYECLKYGHEFINSNGVEHHNGIALFLFYSQYYICYKG